MGMAGSGDDARADCAGIAFGHGARRRAVPQEPARRRARRASIAPVLVLRAERAPHRHMKPAAFEFERATSLAGAGARLAEGGAEAKLIAGE
jgi:hypothetical protein